MALKKCPRCELNYILDDGSLCVVCREEVHGKQPDEDDNDQLCSVCGEAQTLPGQDMCKACLEEFRGMAGEDDGDEEADASEVSKKSASALDEDAAEADDIGDMDDMDDVGGMDDIQDADMDDDLLDDEDEDASILEDLRKAQ